MVLKTIAQHVSIFYLILLFLSLISTLTVCNEQNLQPHVHFLRDSSANIYVGGSVFCLVPLKVVLLRYFVKDILEIIGKLEQLNTNEYLL